MSRLSRKLLAKEVKRVYFNEPTTMTQNNFEEVDKRLNAILNKFLQEWRDRNWKIADTTIIKSFLHSQLLAERERARREVIDIIDEIIERHRKNISLNKGTWMNEMEKFYEGIEFVVKDLDKLLSALNSKELTTEPRINKGEGKRRCLEQ